MRVSRSLTIKQMAMVSAVTMLFVFIFCVILLFHSVQQNRYNTASQLESIARSVREPLSASILKGDIPEGGIHPEAHSARRYREPRRCRAAEPVPGATDELYPGASRPDDGDAPV